MGEIAALVSNSLDIWTAAVERKSSAGRGSGNKLNLYGIERLRSLILDLAVRGKLVPQDAEDEPVSNLLLNIAAERQERAKAGQVRNAKGPSRPSSEPFDLPRGWAWVPLWQTGNIFTGNSINATVRAELETNEAGRPFIATKDVGYGLDPIDYDNGLTVRIDDNRFNVAKAYSVFICAEGGSAGRKMAVSDREISFGNKLIANEPWSSIEPRYILYTYLSDFFFECFSREMTGIIGGISRAKFLALPFPLPPLAEQQRIVAKVDELMALCGALEAQAASALGAHQGLVEALLSTLVNSIDAVDLATNWERLEAHFDALFATEASIDTLKQTLLDLAVRGKLVRQDASETPAHQLLRDMKSTRAMSRTKNKIHDKIAIGDEPFSLPTGWAWDRFDHLIDPKYPIAYGVLVPGNDEVGGVPFVRIADLSLTNPAPSPEKAINAAVDAQFERTRLQGGEILMGVVGSIGKLGVAPASWAGANIARAVCRIVPSPLVNKQFVVWLLQSRFMQEAFKDDTRTLAQPTLNLKLIRLAATPVPPLAEQQRIVAKVDELMALCDALRVRITDVAETQRNLADAVFDQVTA